MLVPDSARIPASDLVLVPDSARIPASWARASLRIPVAKALESWKKGAFRAPNFLRFPNVYKGLEGLWEYIVILGKKARFAHQFSFVFLMFYKGLGGL